ncbi:MAG: nucleotidyl transferase AbiEii/AbiGii toxin family protein [Lachnospiraceae bacterium]|nr:nucleotidyl transferase AbiEii/AbiGii toxin family protein [Lachnospiraceae bacterium]
MIHTSKQLKDKVRNISKGNNEVAKALIRIFMMERFLERVSLSKYKNNFILKGGVLVASIIGVDMRATMDIDTTVKALPLNEEDAERIITEICEIPLEDGVIFKITSVTNIMTDFEYPGIRMILEATLDRMRQPIKLDISTDDVITPAAVEYEYKLMFEDRTISLLSYNTETLLAEKMQTIVTRGLANTRMRDFYDVCGIARLNADKIDYNLLVEAFRATCKKRETVFSISEIEVTLSKIKNDEPLAKMWEQFRKKNFFVGDLHWEDVLQEVLHIIGKLIEK